MKKTSLLKIRISPELKEILRKRAAAAKKSMSEIIRNQIADL